MIWIAGKFGETPLLADFLISLDENYYSSSAGVVDGMKSVFMKCSYLSLSSGRVGTMQRKRAKELLPFFL